MIILRRADRDLIEHADYIANFNLKAARRFQRAAEKAFQSLLAMPGMGGLWEADQASLRDLRVWPIRGFEKTLFSIAPSKKALKSSGSSMPLKTLRPFSRSLELPPETLPAR